MVVVPAAVVVVVVVFGTGAAGGTIGDAAWLDPDAAERREESSSWDGCALTLVAWPLERATPVLAAALSLLCAAAAPLVDCRGIVRCNGWRDRVSRCIFFLLTDKELRHK